MLIGIKSKYYLQKIQSKSKLIEYGIPEELHPQMENDIDFVLLNVIRIIGDFSLKLIESPTEYVSVRLSQIEYLEYSSRYIENLLSSEKYYENNTLLRLLLSVTYYFQDQIGSSKVILKQLSKDNLYDDLSNLELFIYDILNDNIYNYSKRIEDKFIEEYFSYWISAFNALINNGEDINIDLIISKMKSLIVKLDDYSFLNVEIITAILLIKFQQSTAVLLPKYSDRPYSFWRNFIIKNSFFELWESQRLIGENEIYCGKSAVIQLPTGTGKTRSISIIINSKDYSDKNLFIIVAPYRALCDEISYNIYKDFKYTNKVVVNHLSEILIDDGNALFEQDGKKHCIIATPEKIMYYLRLHPKILEKVNTIFFDEAHIFDEENRGLNFEFLLSSFKILLPQQTQKILLSAIMSNPEDINDWFNQEGAVITENSLKPIDKNYAFVDWVRYRKEIFGNLYFEKLSEPDKNFYLPRFVQIEKLEKLNNERVERYFPSLDVKHRKLSNSHDIAIYTSLKLAYVGGTIIFTGKKSSANKILDRFIDLDKRDYNINPIRANSDDAEIEKIQNLIRSNLGEDNIYFEAIHYGLVVHHSGIFDGLRKSAEFAFKNKKIPLLICTSTLAQGVNLPIKHILVSGINQGASTIKIRDFNNLKGRSGRSGYYTEGTIIFTESFFYNQRDSKTNRSARFKWNNYKKLITNDNAEECASVLGALLVNENVLKVADANLNVIELLKMIYEDVNGYKNTYSFVEKNSSQDLKKDNTKFLKYLNQIGSQIENYLLLNIDFSSEDKEEDVEIILQNTLAYYLSDENIENKLRSVFNIVFSYLTDNLYLLDIESTGFKKTLSGVRVLQDISEFIKLNIEKMNKIESLSKFFDFIFSFSYDVFKEDLKIKFKENNQQRYRFLLVNWINGVDYETIIKDTKDWEYVYGETKSKVFTIDDLIYITNNFFGYQLHTFFSSFKEILKMHFDDEKILEYVEDLIRRSKYGLKSKREIVFYELGVSDRFLSKKIADLSVDKLISIKTKNDGKFFIKEYIEDVENVLKFYPSYFTNKIHNL